MSSLFIDRIISQKNPLSAEEIQHILTNINLVVDRPQGGELTPSLRQLYMIAHGSAAFSGLRPSLLTQLISISKSLDEAHTVQQLLASLVLVECSPLAEIAINQILPEGKHGKPPSHWMLPIILAQDPEKTDILAEFIPLIVRWLSTEGFSSELQIKCLDTMPVIASEQCRLLNKDQVHVVGVQMTEWLKHAGLEQAPNPYSKSFFKKDQQPSVTEVDGTPSREFYTILCIGQHYTADQLLNIHTFSLLRSWLLSTRDLVRDEDAEPTSPEDVDAVERVSLSSFSSWGGWGKLDEVSEASLQYCLRVIEQSERKAKVPQDFDLQCASLYEAVSILNHLCQCESTIVPKVFDVIKRLAGRPVALTQPRVMLAILQFFFNHSEMMVYDATPVYEGFFAKTLSSYYKNHAIAFETCLFLSDNLERLCFDTNILFKYFPNIFKLLAWNPRGLIKEYEELLPAFMSPSTSMEIFHVILDLPCLAAALEVQQKNQQSPPTDSSGSLFQLLKSFNDAKFRPLFAFILRNESGRGDTINKLGLVHEVLFSLRKNPRVKMAASIVPALLRLFFEVVLDECDCVFTNKLVPVMMERSCLLYAIPSFQNEVKKVFSENILKLFKKHPKLLLDQCSDIQDFVGSIRNVDGREDFFIHVVWLVGEYLSPAYDSRCLPDVITSMYESLETMAYEIIGAYNSVTPEKNYSPRLPSVLLSTIAKLAARSQDLIPRVLLCLTKLGHLRHYREAESNVLKRKSQELINILQLPNVAAEVLSPPPDIESGRWHTDEQSLQMVLRTASSFLQVSPHGIS